MQNLIEIQNKLKGFSDEQLAKEMRFPSGGVPPFLVLGELKRRQTMRLEQERSKAANTPTVAQEAVAAAGMPTGGVAQMAQAMAPRTSMAENTGIATMMPKQPTRMAGGGVIKANTGLPKPVVLNGFRYNVYPDGRVVRDMVGQPTTPLDPNMTNDRNIIEQVLAAAQNQTVIPEMQPEIDTVAPLASDPTAAVPVNADKLIDEGTPPAMTYNQMVARVKTGLPLTEADLVKSVEAGLLNDQQAADVNSMLDGYVPSKTMQDIANLNPTDNATVTRSVVESLNQPNVSSRNLLTGVNVSDKGGNDTSRPEQGGEDGGDGEDPLKTELDRIAAIEAKSSGALLEFLKDIEKDREKEAIMDLVRFGSILMKPTPTIGQGIADAAIGTLDAKKERKKDYTKNKIAILGLSERIAAQKAAAARSNALLNVQLQNLDLRKQGLDASKNKAAMEALEKKYELLNGEGNYERLMRKLDKDKKLPPAELKLLKELQDLRDQITGTSTSAKKVNTADT